MRVAVLGATGALGAATCRAFATRGWEVTGYSHRHCELGNETALRAALRQADLAVNCAGVIPERARSSAVMVVANAVGPRLLGEIAAEHGLTVLHVSTDCVFSGRRGVGAAAPSPYTVDDEPDAVDLYGRSKALGEDPRTIVIRTSFVNPRHGLWAWLVRQASAGVERVPGYSQAYWSGSTVEAVAEGIVGLAEAPVRSPVEHLATATPVTKYDVLRLLVEHLGLDLRVEPVSEPIVDRSLIPTFELRPFAEALRALR